MEKFDFINFARVLQIEFREGRKRLMRTIFYMFIIYSSVFALFQTIGGWHPAINPDFRGSPYAIRTEVNDMVTIIGYDRDHYYTAAGNANGDVTIYAKSQLICSDYFYIFNTTNIPFK